MNCGVFHGLEQSRVMLLPGKSPQCPEAGVQGRGALRVHSELFPRSLPQGFKADSPNLGAVWMSAGDWPASEGAPPCAGCKGSSVSNAEGLLFLHVRAFPCVACVGTQSTRKKQRDFSLNSSSSLLLCSSQLLFLCTPLRTCVLPTGTSALKAMSPACHCTVPVPRTEECHAEGVPSEHVG